MSSRPTLEGIQDYNAHWCASNYLSEIRIPATQLQLLTRSKQELVGVPQQTDWHKIHAHSNRVQKLSFGYQRYTDTGAIYRVAWAALAAFGRYVRRRPGGPVGPLCLNLRALHVEYYDRRKFYVTECFPYIAGRALQELHLHCDGDPDGTTPGDILELSRVMPLLFSTSPNLQYISIRDTREHPNHDVCLGAGTLLGKLRHLRHFATSMTLEKQHIAYLAAMPKLTNLSLALFMNLAENPFLSNNLAISPPFQALDTLVLDVKHLELATGCLKLLETPTLRKLGITTYMWQDDSTIERCFHAVAKQEFIRELTVCVASNAAGLLPTMAVQGQCNMNVRSISTLFSLSHLQSLSLHALDKARFETDLDDSGVIAMAEAWPQLHSLTIVQGSFAPRHMQLPPARTTMGSLLALRDHCPHLAGLSISLDTTDFDIPVLEAACAQDQSAGAALRKLNIGTRSSPVSNHSVAAQILHGLFPNLRNIHDGTSVAWDQQSSDWQEVGAILRKLTQTPLPPDEELDFVMDWDEDVAA